MNSEIVDAERTQAEFARQMIVAHQRDHATWVAERARLSRAAPNQAFANDDDALRALDAFVGRMAAARNAHRPGQPFVAMLTDWFRWRESRSFYDLHVDIVGAGPDAVARIVAYQPRPGAPETFFADAVVARVASHFNVAIALYPWTPTKAEWGDAWEANTHAQLRYQCPLDASGWVAVLRA